MIRSAAILTSTLLACSLKVHAEESNLKHVLEGCKNVPSESRMRMYWRVFGPAWQRDEIAYQFDLLKAAGVGGVMTMFFYPVAVDDATRGIQNQQFLSPEFLETCRVAAGLAKERGLRFSVQGGAGWPYGGPMVKPEDVSMRIRRVLAKGTSDANTLLKKPGVRLIACFQNGKRVNLDGQAGLSTEPLTVFVSEPTGMQVKRPSLGADGPVLNHYRTQSVRDFLDKSVAPILNAAPRGIESIFCDSFEVYGGNWTEALPLEFKRRRGYDLVEHLPALFDEKDPTSADVRFDYWRTLAELCEQRFTVPLYEWSKKHGVKLEIEAYGTPPNPLTAFRYSDVPTGEQYEWKGFSFSRYASSGGHLAGKKIIGAEAWTWTGIPNRLIDRLSDLKRASDLHFLAGINDLTGVDWAYSPRSVPSPGWLPYFGPAMNQHNPQWPAFHYLADYVNRCQWLLRQGKPVADVAVYLPVEEKFARGPVEQMALDFHLRDHFVTGPLTGEFGLANAEKHHSDLIHAMVTGGYAFDGIDFWTLLRRAKVQNGRLICGDGDYRVIVLPHVEGMDVDALAKVVAFAKSGGTVLVTGRKPDRGFGLRTRNDFKIRQLVMELLGDSLDGIWHKVGKGAALWSANEGRATIEALRNRVPPAITWQRSFEHVLEASDNSPIPAIKSPPVVEWKPPRDPVAFVQRSTPDADIFFVANTSDQNVWSIARFRSRFHQLCKLDPLTSSVTRLSQSAGDNVEVELSGYGSAFYIASDGFGSNIPRATAPVKSTIESVRFTSTWQVRFEGPDAPPPLKTEELLSWTKWPGGAGFSGIGVYECSFEWLVDPPKQVRLAFWDINCWAEVTINGKLAGAVWLPPYEVDITPFFKPGLNTIQVRVGNLLLNRFISQSEPDMRDFKAKYGTRFPDPQERKLVKEPVPSGLIGPVWLRVNR